MNTPTLTPAYGRDYTSSSQAKLDFDADKDFLFIDITSRYDGSYVNKSQLLQAGYKVVKIRYSHLTRFMIVNLSQPQPVVV